jgi:hypothetical protein
MSASEIAVARHAFESALFDGCSSDVTVPLGRALAELENAADPALKVRRLRTKAIDHRAAYVRHMDSYGAEIGRAAACKDPIIAKLIASAAKAALDEAGECLTKALAAEAEADAIQTGGFAVLFDGVSAKQRVEA